MMIDFDPSPSPSKPVQSRNSLEETSKSLEWILDKNIDKQKRDEICKIIGEEESRNIIHVDHLSSASDRPQQEIEVEEVKHVKFGNSVIKAENVGEADNLGHYVECMESVESAEGDTCREREILKNIDSTTEYMTDEILSMMLFNDIHDCPMHPIRETNFIDYFKDKYPFNRDLGIDTSQHGTEKYVDELFNFIKQNHLETILTQLKKPIEVDPLKELKNLQALDDFYLDEAPESEKDSDEKGSADGQEQDNGYVIPQNIFYEFEQIRRSQLTSFPVYNEKGEKEFSDKEIEDKVHFTFIHDKVVFDTLNTAIN